MSRHGNGSGPDDRPEPAGSGDPADPARAGAPTDPPDPGEARIPEGLVSSVVDLVHTGPVLLGAYTIAELTAVDAIVDFLEARPSDDELAEAVRSLAARELLLAGSTSDQVQVRGDLGIAVAFQQRARKVLDARTTGTVPGEPWRVLLLPQPEQICLVIRIDALGVHQIGLYRLEDALSDLTEWLPRGSAARPDPAMDVDAVLTAAERSALVTVTRYTAKGSAETAGDSTDLVLARSDGRLHVLSRDPGDHDRLVPTPVEGRDGVQERLTALLAQ
jgi:hypothetical protein